MKPAAIFSFLLVAAVIALAGCADDPPREAAPSDTETETADDPGLAEDPSIPQSCDEVSQFAQAGRPSAVGCEFYAMPLDNGGLTVAFQIALSNVHFQSKAHYSIHEKGLDPNTLSWQWSEVASGTIDSLRQAVVTLPARYRTGCAPQGSQEIQAEGAYKIVSDTPLIAYQFHPIYADWTTDASLLLPVQAWSENYQILGYRSVDTVQAGRFAPSHPEPFSLAYVTIVAQKDDTQVTIEPSVTLLPGQGGDCSDPTSFGGNADPFTVTLNESDVIFLHADIVGDSLNGTTVRSNPGHPVAVFTGHQCAFVPEWAEDCDRLEEQLPGVEYWGTEFVAARMPNRNQTTYSDPVLWQIAASADNTTVHFQAHSHVQGLPASDIVLQKGEVAEYYVYGSTAEPGDFLIQASRPIAVLQYMTSFEVTRGAEEQVLLQGDPSVAYLPPTEQFLLRYVVHVPSDWPDSYLVITRPIGTTLYLDNKEVADTLFQPTIDSAWEIGRIPVGTGTHIAESADAYHPFGLTVVGLSEMSSYAFTGGMGFAPINSLE